MTDACIKRVSNRMPPTNFTTIDDDVDVNVSQNEDASGHIDEDENTNRVIPKYQQKCTCIVVECIDLVVGVRG